MANTVMASARGRHCGAAEIQRFAENAPRWAELETQSRAFHRLSGIACSERRVIENIRRRKGSMSKIKFSNYQAKQSRIVAGVCVPISDGVGDYDELLREAVRVALRVDMNPTRDDWDDLYDRIRKLMAAYTASPEGEGEDACTLMARLAACVADVIPMAIRKGLITPSSTGATPQTQLPAG